MDNKKQPWIYSLQVDSLFILLPPFIILAFVFIFPQYFNESSEVSPLAWIFLILLIDVAHVYSTLYRTYFDKETFQKHRIAFINIPLFSWIAGVVIYEFDSLMFWRVLAYLAVFHFIRQQYGFTRIYSRKETFSKLNYYIDTFAIYYATIYPLIFWHLHAPRNFHWFVEGDFYYFKSDILYYLSLFLYLSTLLIYIVKELVLFIKERNFNFPKNAIILGTFFSWYFGIVYFNGDLIFTTLNVVSHGIPYMALIWIYGRKKYVSSSEHKGNLMSKIFMTKGLVIFLGVIFFLAYIEEGIWDSLIWKDHKEIFPSFNLLASVTNKNILAFLVPLLSLPQIVHYVIDGFIWRLSKDSYDWKKVTLER